MFIVAIDKIASRSAFLINSCYLIQHIKRHFNGVSVQSVVSVNRPTVER